MKLKKTCLLCGSTNLRLIKTIQEVDIYECHNCKIAITDQSQMNQKELYNSHGLYDFQLYKKTEFNQKQKCSRVIDILNRHLKKGTILEIGAGFGLFASMLSENNHYQITIIEPHLPLNYLDKNGGVVKYKKDIRLFLKQNQLKFDAIIMLDVLEHFSNPTALIDQLKTHLKPHGYVIIQLPNYKSIMARVCKNWSWWMVEDHYYHFSPLSLTKFLNAVGFNLTYMGTYETLYDFRKNFDGNFTAISPPFLRKLIKVLSYTIGIPFYIVCRSLLWRFNKGGLILTLATI